MRFIHGTRAAHREDIMRYENHHIIDIENGSRESCCSPGTGHIADGLFDNLPCMECNGSGFMASFHDAYVQRRWRGVPSPCPYCDGTGRLIT
jgi:DnaJ-class molecular chaperone